MKKLAVALLLILTSSVLATAALALPTATIVIRPGENWVSAPLVPINPAPESVFAACIDQCSIERFGAATQSPVEYPSPAFGGVLLGDGYKVYNPTQSTFCCTYQGVPDGVPGVGGEMTDMWISLAGSQTDGTDAGGIHLVGQPYNHSTSVGSIRFVDGTNALTFEQAVSEGWVDGLWRYMDADTQTMRTFGLSSLGADSTILVATHAYEVRTYRDHLAVIIGADVAVAEPASLAVLAMGCAGAFGFLRRSV